MCSLAAGGAGLGRGSAADASALHASDHCRTISSQALLASAWCLWQVVSSDGTEVMGVRLFQLKRMSGAMSNPAPRPVIGCWESACSRARTARYRRISQRP